MKSAAADQFFGRERYPFGLHKTPFPMTLLWPRIGEKKLNSCQRSICDAMPHQFDCVSAGHPNIRQVPLCQFTEKVSNSGSVNFHSDEIFVRSALRHLGQAFTRPETNFQDDWGMSPEYSRQIQIRCATIHPILRPKLLVGPTLRLAKAPVSLDEATNRTSLLIDH